MKFALLFSFILLIFTGCSKTNSVSETYSDTINISLSIGNDFITRSTSTIDSLPLSVNRILIIPFQKLNLGLSDNDSTNFIPAWNFVHQYDINTFPNNSLKLGLPKSFRYKVLIIGYNQNDYNYNQPNASTNRFDITSQPTPTTLANFRLYPKSPNNVPEFFTCFCTAKANNTNLGNVFTPEAGTDITLSGNLKRIVSGLGIYLTNVPAYVTSVTLSAEKMVKAIRVINSSVLLVQQADDGESRIIRQVVPQGGKVNFNEFLLPINSTNSTLFYLNVAYDSRNTVYTINVPDGQFSNSKRIILPLNEVVKISGNFDKTGISFYVNNNINLDDNQWDGLQ